MLKICDAYSDIKDIMLFEREHWTGPKAVYYQLIIYIIILAI